MFFFISCYFLQFTQKCRFSVLHVNFTPSIFVYFKYRLGALQHRLALEEANLPGIAKEESNSATSDDIIADDIVTVDEVAAKFVIPQDFNSR